MKLKILFTLTIVIGILDKSIAQGQNDVYDLAGYDVQLVGDLGEFEFDWKVKTVEEGLEIATIKISSDQPAMPPKFSLKWNLPSSNVAGHWSTSSYLNKNIRPDWSPSRVKSMLAREAPVISLFGHDDLTQLNFSISDALNTSILTTAVREEDGMIYNEIILFSEKHKELTEYEIQVRFDTRPMHYAAALNQVADWWASFDEYKPLAVPEDARKPMYSSWYSYHQSVSRKELVEECKLAKAMGFESIIVDDGWQTLDSQRGYAYTGDWLPERIPDMKEFVQDVHDLGMKFLLWYSVPLVGEKSEAYIKMKGKFLRYWDGQGAYELDPRYPEVRKFVIGTYIKAAKDWDLDGFKLDFMARFTANSKTELVIADGRDFASVNEATDKLMTDLVSSLKEINPEIMIEFRQPYTGPAMRKYGNIFRAGDCPNLEMVNRVRTTDLRMISGNTAVHSDMLMWHYDEVVEVAAFQITNILFSVPQISVRLDDIPKDHFEMIKFYTDYWLKNRDVLIDGKMIPSNPMANYPLITGIKDDKRITALFEDLFLEVNSTNEKYFDIVNSKTTTKVIIDHIGKAATYKYEIVDCMGNVVKSESKELTVGAHSFEVPVSGIIAFERLD